MSELISNQEGPEIPAAQPSEQEIIAKEDLFDEIAELVDYGWEFQASSWGTYDNVPGYRTIMVRRDAAGTIQATATIPSGRWHFRNTDPIFIRKETKESTE